MNAYAGQGTCAPSRASLLTGRFPTTFGYEFTPVTPAASYAISLLGYPHLPGIFHSHLTSLVNQSVMILPPHIPTFGEIFQQDPQEQDPYHTLFLGKWHNGHTPSFHALTRGFDEKLAVNIISSYLPTGHSDSVDCLLDDPLDRFLRANIRYQIEKDGSPYFEPNGYLTDYLSEEAVKAIEANQNQPFLMYLAFTAPHTPLQALQADYDSLADLTDLDHCSRVYASMLLALDRAVGRVLDSLETMGLSDNTLVIFSSDNGSPSYINLRDTNSPYRGWKASHFEGGIKVPLLMKWPKMIPSGMVVEDLVSHVDIFPTIVSAAGLDHLIKGNDKGAGEINIDGINLLPLVNRREEPSAFSDSQQLQCTEREEGEGDGHHQELHAEERKREKLCTVVEHNELSVHNSTAVSGSGHHEYLFWRSGHVTTLRTSEWKLQLSARPNKIWLFNLQEDPTERVNLATVSEHQSDLTRMLEMIHLINSSQCLPLWPALSESPVLIDKIATDAYEEGDEYVYWPN
jgi:arylsulfatase A-like enzyme